MNIYGKLQNARVKFQNTNIKKSGLNKFAGYDYFELGDFLPVINNIMQEEGLCSFINFTQDLAILTLVNTDKPDEQIQFTSPMSTATLKGCHDVQNLGAAQTYLRRYLYINAFEIVEHDALDAVTGKEEKPAVNNQNRTANKKDKTSVNMPTDLNADNDLIDKVQRSSLFFNANNNTELVKKILMQHGYTKSEQVKKAEFNSIVDEIKKAVATA